MPYVFKTPTVSEGPIGDHRLFMFYEQDRGVTVARYGDDFYEMRYPSEDDLQEADEYWVGGYEHVVTDATASMLSDAGYDDYLTEIV